MLKRLLFFVMASFIIGIFLWAAFAPKESLTDKVARQLEEQKKKSDLFLKGITFSEIEDGKKYWEIKAITSQMNKDTGLADLTDVKGVFFKGRAPSVSFISPQVHWNMNKKKIEILMPLGYDRDLKFSAPRMTWSMTDKMLSSEGDVVLEKKGVRIDSRSLTADIDAGRFILGGSPSAVISAKDNNIAITAGQFEVDSRTGIVRAAGGARAVRGGFVMTSNSMDYRPSRSEFTARGSVRIRYRDISASSASVIYNAADDTAVLTGNAAASRGDNDLQGDKLKIDLKNNKIFVEGRSKVFIDDQSINGEVK